MNLNLPGGVAIFGALVGCCAFNVNSGFAGIGQAILEAKFALQNVVNGADNKVDYRFRSVPDPPAFAQCRVVFSKKGLVKMDDWVVLLGGFAEFEINWSP